MKINNICKFPVSTFDTSSMSISCFVRESNTDIMKKALTLTTNRIVFCIDGNGSACVNNSILKLQTSDLKMSFWAWLRIYQSQLLSIIHVFKHSVWEERTVDLIKFVGVHPTNYKLWPSVCQEFVLWLQL